MKEERYDVIIVGSGTAGGTLFSQLSLLKPDLKVLLLEKGRPVKKGEEGKFWPFFLKHYRKLVLGSRSKEGVIIYAAEALGGTSIISCGNMVRNEKLEIRLFELGIGIASYIKEAESKIGVTPLSFSRIIKGSRLITETGFGLGFPFKQMPKGISNRCMGCGLCVKGCSSGAKWDVRAGINETRAHYPEYEVMTNVFVRQISRADAGYKIILHDNMRLSARIVVLAAGGIATPCILQNSGINAGRGLSIHPFVVSYGKMGDGTSQVKGISMATYYEPEEGILLSPFIDEPSQIPFACGWWWWLRNPLSKCIGIMTKVADPEAGGRVNADGSVNYNVPPAAEAMLKRGADIAEQIIKKAGGKAIVTSFGFKRGAHPQGTAKIGKVVDSNLEVVDSSGLFVSDASVIPLATGTPPILTLVALNMRLAEYLSKKI